MTIDEAIKHCMDIAETQEMCSNGKKCAEEHRQLAGWLKELKALKEQESCEDCISRQAVLDGLASIAKVKAKSDAQKSLMGRVMFFTEHLPSVTPARPRGEWIPVSERLPEKQDCYLVTTKWKGSCSNDVYIETNIDVYREKPKEWNCKDVIAWMPLPEPYEELKRNLKRTKKELKNAKYKAERSGENADSD